MLTKEQVDMIDGMERFMFKCSPQKKTASRPYWGYAVHKDQPIEDRGKIGWPCARCTSEIKEFLISKGWLLVSLRYAVPVEGSKPYLFGDFKALLRERDRARRTLARKQTRTADAAVSVYLIEVVGQSLVKVGVASDPQARLKAISTSSPGPVEIVATVSCPSRDDALAAERELHEVMAEGRANGEWFDVSELPLPAIDALGVAFWMPDLAGCSSLEDAETEIARRRVAFEAWVEERA